MGEERFEVWPVVPPMTEFSHLVTRILYHPHFFRLASLNSSHFQMAWKEVFLGCEMKDQSVKILATPT